MKRLSAAISDPSLGRETSPELKDGARMCIKNANNIITHTTARPVTAKQCRQNANSRPMQL